MAVDFVARKRTELRSKSASLAREFAFWRSASAAGQPFEKHDSQIRRITSRLGALVAARTRELDALADGDVLLRGPSIAEKVLAAHLIWEFFRTRVAMRADPYLKPCLQACDEFAWACYEPARSRFQQTAGGDPADRALSTKEPPLVYLNGGWSPFAVPRDRAFQLDRPTFDGDRGGTPWLQAFEFADVMRALPVPLIGLPWYQVSHLPDALVLGHEMGHVVEWDFALTGDIERAVRQAGVDEQRRPAWLAWRSETFADIYGCLAGGPRFGTTLADFLAGDKDQVCSERRTPGNWGDYPMRWLRLQVVAETLGQMGFTAEAARLIDDWALLYGRPVHQTEFRDDVRGIVAALLAGPYPSLKGTDAVPPSLPAVLSFGKDALGKPVGEGLVPALRAGAKMAHAGPRELFAAARALYDEDPEAFKTGTLSRSICEVVAANTPAGRRGTMAQALDAVVALETLAGERWF